MRKKTLLICLAFLVLLLSACKGWEKKKEVIAWVSGEPIYLVDYQENLERNWKSGQDSGASELSFQLKLKCLEQMIEQKLILKEAHRLGINTTEQELNSELEKLIDLNNPEVQQSLEEKGINWKKWKEQIRQDILIRKTIDTVFKHQIYFSEKELRDYYEKHLPELRLPESARVRQILLMDEAEAREVLKQLQAGADFKEMARKHSKNLEAENGGDMGWVTRGHLPDVLDEFIFSSNPGTLSGLIKSQFGYHILLVEERSPAREPSFEEAKERIEKKLTEERKKTLYQRWIQYLWKSNKISINYQLL